MNQAVEEIEKGIAKQLKADLLAAMLSPLGEPEDFCIADLVKATGRQRTDVERAINKWKKDGIIKIIGKKKGLGNSEFLKLDFSNLTPELKNLGIYYLSSKYEGAIQVLKEVFGKKAQEQIDVLEDVLEQKIKQLDAS